MATLLGTATLNTAFTTTSEAVVVTDDLNRVTTTAYRKPVAVHSSGSATDFRPLYLNDVNLYIQGGYVEDDYLENNEYFEIIATASSPNNPGSQTVFCNFNFLEVDPTAIIANVEVRMTLQSTQGGYSSYPPYGTQDELHYGKVKMLWADRGSGVSEEMVTTKVTTNELTELAFTLTPVGLDPAGFWTGIGMGNHHMIKLTLEGVVYPHGGTGFAYPGLPSLNMQIYALEARANYTGRTRFVTGFKSPATISGGTGSTGLQSTGYGFAIPSDHIIDGVAVRFGADYPGSGPGTGGSNNYSSVADVMHFESGGSQVSSNTIDLDADTVLAASPEWLGVETGERHETLYQAIDYNNTDTAITTAEVNASDFGIITKFFPRSGSVGFDLEPSTLDINIAYVGPITSGDIDLNTTSTLTATPNLIHGFTADQINELSSTVTLTALGGFLLEGAPQTQAATFTTTLGTAGRIRPGEATSTSAFTVTVTAVNDISGSALTFPTATMTVSAGVERTTPANINTAITLAPTGLIGRIRTNHTATAPAVATVPELTDIFLIKAPAQSQVFTCATQTRTHSIAEELRTHTIAQQTRTTTIPMQGENTAHQRRLTVPQQTRTTPVEALQ